MGDRAKGERIDPRGRPRPRDHPTADRVHVALAPPRAGFVHHLVCLSGDRVIDISDARLDTLPLPDTGRFGSVVSDFKVQLRGIGKECREQEDKT